MLRVNTTDKRHEISSIQTYPSLSLAYTQFIMMMILKSCWKDGPSMLVMHASSVYI